MIQKEWTHDPDAKLDYTVDWTTWLGVDEISTSVWVIPTGLVQASPAPSHDGAKATVWISGGMVGQVYTVTNRITTAAGRTEDRSFALRVAQK